MRATRLVCCISVAIVTTACSNTPASAPDTRASDVQTVKTFEAEWTKVVQSKDLDKALSHAADDAITLYPGATILHGKPAIENYLAPMYADSNFALVDYQNMRSEASKGGDLVFTAGAQSVTVTDPKTKKPVTDKGKYLTVCQKQADGSWKVIADTFNSDSGA